LAAKGKKMDPDKTLARIHDEMDECVIKAVKRVGGNLKECQMIIPWGGAWSGLKKPSMIST
jgi:hypothetical protein